MLNRKKKRNYSIPKNVYEAPLKYRFTFVPEGSTYYEGYWVKLSGNINTIKKAFYIACEIFKRDCEPGKGSVAVFYGDVESPDCKDTLYGAFSVFE